MRVSRRRVVPRLATSRRRSFCSVLLSSTLTPFGVRFALETEGVRAELCAGLAEARALLAQGPFDVADGLPAAGSLPVQPALPGGVVDGPPTT